VGKQSSGFITVTVVDRPIGTDSAIGTLAWCKQALTVLDKELRVELRTRQAIGTTLLFALVTICVLAYLLALKSIRLDVDAALLWIVLFFSGMAGLSRVFVREEEMLTADALRLTVRSTAIFAGKLAFNGLLLLAIEAFVSPLLFVALSASMRSVNYSLLTLVLLLGGVGLASGSTFVASLVAPATRGGIRSSLFLIAAFPVLVPLLLAATSATVVALSPDSSPLGTGRNDCIVLACYDTVTITTSFLLFGYVWNGA
jgi:heme exporter protein B